jgi:hypothetical protein
MHASTMTVAMPSTATEIQVDARAIAVAIVIAVAARHAAPTMAPPVCPPAAAVRDRFYACLRSANLRVHRAEWRRCRRTSQRAQCQA